MDGLVLLRTWNGYSVWQDLYMGKTRVILEYRKQTLRVCTTTNTAIERVKRNLLAFAVIHNARNS